MSKHKVYVVERNGEHNLIDYMYGEDGIIYDTEYGIMVSDIDAYQFGFYISSEPFD